MLDVHPPHEAVHTWKDFLLHIATITVGLLIAVGLEQTVEYFHHRHIAEVARENIHHEIETNRKQADDNLRLLEREIKDMQANAVAARTLRDDPHGDMPKTMRFDFDWSSFDEAAWTTSRDSLALTYLPTSEVQTYADIYNQQQVVNQYALATFSRQVEAGAPLVSAGKPEMLKPDEVLTLVHETSIVAMRLMTLHQIVQQLDQQYVDALKHKQ